MYTTDATSIFTEGLFFGVFFFGGEGGGGLSLVFPRENSSFLTFWTDLV